MSVWLPASLSNNGSNWTEQVTLNPGTNTIAAYAVDSSGNISLTNTVKVDYILSAPLTVQIVGVGNPDAQLQQRPRWRSTTTYSMKATPDKGFALLLLERRCADERQPETHFYHVLQSDDHRQFQGCDQTGNQNHLPRRKPQMDQLDHHGDRHCQR